MKKILCAVFCALSAASLTACGTELNASSSSASSAEVASSVSSSSSSSAASESTGGTELSDGNYDLSFTDRDCDPSYDESSACRITFSSGTVSADSGSGVSAEGSKVTISAEGVYIISGESSNGQILVNAGDNDKIQLVLDNLSLSSNTSPLVIQNADKVFITLADGSENTLSDSSSYELTVDDSTVDAAIFSKADLTLNGSGALNVTGNYKHAVVSKDDLVITGGTYGITAVSSAVDGKDCVKIKTADMTVKSGGDGVRSTNTDETDTRGFVYIAGGSFSVNCTNDAFQAASLLRIDGGSFDVTSNGGSENAEVHVEAEPGMGMYSSDSDSDDSESAKGFKCADTLKLNGGTFAVNTSDDAFHSNNAILISGGEYTIKSGDDGFHADSTLTIDGGTVNIEESYEGIEAGDITVNDGSITVAASDDGFNAAGGSDDDSDNDFFSSSSDKSLVINGGYIYVDAEGDGLDSNGTLTITGGTTLVNGPGNDGNAAVDYGTSAQVTGGVLVALGSSGMAESVSGSGQGVIMDAVTEQSAGTTFALCDSNGTVIASLTSARKFDCVTVSAPEIASGSTYTLVCGGTVENADSHGYASSSSVSGGTTADTVSMTSETYSNISGMGGGAQPDAQGGAQGGGDMGNMGGNAGGGMMR